MDDDADASLTAQVRALWSASELGPPNNMRDFLLWYRTYLASLKLTEKKREALIRDEVQMWVDVCYSPPRHG